ncbi:MAG: DNA gyrase subunit A [Peptoniphilaceae bacterium]|nr:DNA gyrase subunit A [Peptoniphilaceae bacterium]MDD7434054.1 DNA gyrase subunit A [Peptoniphilaceae bacterium]MDY3075803.1 DNA gyrase subunit A [Peptoniphilaceae bacterium]MDY3986875.1 DNA gyrase subunit A [Peptoniphilaceae bacterium]MDY4196125.1 DNA gyrase subunit A [Peptoniphilaceae bacterium]
MSEELNKSNILGADLEKEMRSSYLDYSMSVIVGRALPDVRDGLKPVHRRILYGMSQLGLTPDKPYRKSARLVGDVMGRFHPHGDSAIYDAVVRLAQPFNTRYMLADGQGNYGSVDGDGAAAMRYTEVRMTKLAQEMLRDLNKNTVDFQPNFDEEEKEPVVLPSRFPNLIVNGSSGIAVGMATNMAPHNLKEAIDACIAYMYNPDITTEELMKIIPGPDFPTGAQIMGRKEIIKAYETGRGKIKMRAVARVDEIRGRNRIVVTEIPYQVNKAALIKKIADLVKEKRIEGISDIRDDTNRTGLRIVIDLKRDAIPKVVLNNLYKYTAMESTFGIINLALVDNTPRILSMKELIQYYVAHQEEVVTRRTRYDLEKAEARAHIIEGLRKAIDVIDEIIRIIRSSYDTAQIKKIFLERFGLDDVQSQAILDMQLKRLSGLEREKLDEEYKELLKQIAWFREILGSEKVLFRVIEDELREIRDKYGDARRTKIMPEVDEINIEDLIQEQPVVVSMTERGYIKRTNADEYRVQNRGGKGIRGMTTREGDFVQHLIVVSTHDGILFFTNRGKVFMLNAYELPEGSRTAKGQAIVNLLQLEPEEKIQAMFPINDTMSKGKYFVMMTKEGIIKKTDIELFRNIRSKGIRAITLADGDELNSVRIAGEKEEVVAVTRHGMAIHFGLGDVRPIGRNGMGVRGIRLDRDDEVIGMDVVTDTPYVLIVTEGGYGKKTRIEHYTLQNRGGKGLKTYRISKKTGNLVAGMLVAKEDEILMISQNNDLIRLNVTDVSTLGRATQGVKLKDVKSEEDRIVAVAKYIDSYEGGGE